MFDIDYYVLRYFIVQVPSKQYNNKYYVSKEIGNRFATGLHVHLQSIYGCKMMVETILPAKISNRIATKFPVAKITARDNVVAKIISFHLFWNWN